MMSLKGISRDFLYSLTSTSASSTFSDSADIASNMFSDLLFPDCDHLHFVSKLSETKFPVYLVSCSNTNKLYAIKLFYWEDDEPSQAYIRELRFAEFSHPNLVKIISYKDEQELFDAELDSIKVSYILMEYAKYGDLFHALVFHKLYFDEVMVRTYFHQLIEGLQALHSQGAAHLDLKLENLLIGDDCTLKITDFDLSYRSEDSKVTSRGTKNHRAPEIRQNKCTNPYAADIYSAGIILFLLKTGGKLPFTESVSFVSLDSADLKDVNSKLYWKKRCEALGQEVSFFSEEFKELFTSMTRSDPKERPTIEEIKKSRWFNMNVYTHKQVEDRLGKRLSC